MKKIHTCFYAADKEIGKEMLNWLRGPRPLNGQDISFLNDRFRDGKCFLWEQYLLTGVRTPIDSDTWV